MDNFQITDIPESLYNPARLSPASVATEPFARYYWHMVQDLMFVAAYGRVLEDSPLLNPDKVGEIGSKAQSFSDILSFLQDDAPFRFVLLEEEISGMMLVRTVSNMLVYIDDVLLELALKKYVPILKDKDAGTSDDLEPEELAQLIRKRVDEKSQRGFGKVIAYLEGKGVDVNLDENQKSALSDIITDRNLIVHQHGIVNDRYIERRPGTKLNRGDSLHIDLNCVSKNVRVMLDFVGRFDDDVRDQFEMETVRTKEFVAKRCQSRLNTMLGPAFEALSRRS